MIVRKVKDFRNDCKSDCKVNCFAGGCPYAGMDCARFEKLLDFEYETSTRRNNGYK